MLIDSTTWQRESSAERRRTGGRSSLGRFKRRAGLGWASHLFAAWGLIVLAAVVGVAAPRPASPATPVTLSSGRALARNRVLASLPGITLSPLQELALRAGQSLTLLPNGQILLAGGFGNNNDAQVTNDVFVLSSTGKVAHLTSGLSQARAGHTATLLPDGSVLVFGGVGVNGQVVATSELFDPARQTFSPLPEVIAVPRAFHTATVLTDGSVLLAGGVEAGGRFADDVQLWDYRTRQALSQHAPMSIMRQGHTAELLSDGAVRISGGTDQFDRPALVDEYYDPVEKRFRFAGSSQPEERAVTPAVAESLPADGDTDVALQDPIAVRFTSLLRVLTVSSESFVLLDPDASIVPVRVTPVEEGRLVFVLPLDSLQPGSKYMLRIRGASGGNGREVAETLIHFTTAGQPPEGTAPDWVPNSTWTDNAGTTRFQELPALHARPGVTALSGQVLKLNGWPLEHVTLEMDGRRARSDSTGRFLMTGVTAGHHVLWIDATTANRREATYGVYEVGVTIQPNKTNVLDYTIWMSRLDMEHAVTVASPTTGETVVTNPFLPGLELHLPAGTVVTDRFGKAVREISITPIPLNKPPFPLPAGVPVPIYFTIQPGGAYIKVENPGSGPKGARLIYPNAFHFKPATAFQFWNYDAEARGWFVYGNGKVSADGRSVIPDPGVEIYEFTGAMVANPGDGVATGPLVGGVPAQASDPVQLSTGQFVYTKTDLAVSDILRLEFTRTYVSGDNISRSFGIGFTDSYDLFTIGDHNAYTYQELTLPDGGRVRFDRISSGSSFSDAVYVHTSAHDAFYGAILQWNGDSTQGNWLLTLKNGSSYIFPESFNSTSSFCQAALQISDRYGNTVQIQRTPHDRSSTNPTPPTDCVLLKITSPNGRYVTFQHDSQGRITQAQDNLGRTVAYAYDTAGRLSTVTDVNGGVTTYTYDSQNRMLTIEDARGIVYLTNQYDSSGRVIKQTQADNGAYLFNWTPTSNTSQGHFYAGPGGTGVTTLLASGCWVNGAYTRTNAQCQEGYQPLIQQVDVTDPRGYVRRVVFNSAGYISSDTHALNQPEQQTVTYAYYGDNTLQSITDALGRATSFTYDGQANALSVTRLSGTSNAVTSSFTYTSQFNEVASATDPLGHSSSFSYDSSGNLLTATDPLSHQTTFTYNAQGQMLTASDALSNAVQFGYAGGDLASVTDPLGNVSTQSVDAVGRVAAAMDALGNTTKYQYSNLNLLTQVTDAQGSNTSFSYDANGNLLALTDALNHATGYTYDNMDRVLTRTDSLQRQESYTYDLNGNLASTTDRKGQVTAFTYDGLNRATLAGFGANGGSYQSTITYTYDAGNRMTQAVDSIAGTITDGYDNLDRLTSETTPQGSISYGYDSADRQTSMQVAGQTQVSYTYDNADRLTQIAQSSSTTSFGYDNANRRTSLTLPNNVVVSYSYNNDSHLTGITYQFGSSTLGNLSYVYDQLGRRTQVSGSFARTGLPGAVSSATYDASNELTRWNETTLSYDNNGNMLSDGSDVFTWNARNQVATLNNVSLQYDAFGRRVKNLAGTSFLYDGPNAVQELFGSTVTANLLTGGIDEVFSRTDSSGAFAPLKDALGSAIVLVDTSGNLQTSYTYDPYGNTSVTGTSNANEFQYTGRENEGNGLYFYRTRYYSPLLGRFISEDPLRFAGGDLNLYAYVRDDPVGWVDSTGENRNDVRQLISKAIQLEQEMNDKGLRNPGTGDTDGNMNNILSTWSYTYVPDDPIGGPGLFPLTVPHYLGCGGQADVVATGLIPVQAHTHDVWTLNKRYEILTRQHILPHQWLEYTSSNPNDPKVVIDPWLNYYQLVPRGQSLNPNNWQILLGGSPH